MNWNLIKHFNRGEFLCKCGCGQERMEFDFVEKLDKVRNSTLLPIIINSGYRCLRHDKEEGGSGNHTTGMAADIKCSDSRTRYMLLKELVKHFNRIGVAKTFIHVDDVPGKDPEVCWMY